MPIINGLKMACEPCIRGHRSTKCTHAKERLMVPVRKPGRPLSVCPHPPGRPCACGGITAAIPRTQKCGCGPSTPTPELPPPESPALKGSMSPTRRTFQVQKASSKAATRKQSFDIATLERMDPESYNIHSAPPYRTPVLPRTSSTGNGDKAVSPKTSGYSLEYMAALSGPPDRSAVAGNSDNRAGYSLTQQPDSRMGMPSLAIKPETPRSAVGGPTNGSYFDDFDTSSDGTERNAATASDGAVASKAVTPAVEPKSCCAGKGSSTAVNGNGNPRHPPTAAPQPLGHFEPHITTTTNGGSLATHGTALLHHHLGVAGAPMMGTFTSPVVQPIFFTHSTDPTMYIYPPYYGTYQHPIQPPQWRQPMSPPGGLGYAFSGTHAHAHMGMGVPLAPGMSLGVNDEAAAGGTSHQCSCGDSCNCLGCPAHPYNEVTQDYVRSAMNIMTEEQPRGEARGARGAKDGVAPKPTTPARAVGGGCCGSGGGERAPVVDAEDMTPVAVQAQQSTGAAGGPDSASSPPQAQTPSEASAASEDQTHLSASDFLFVTYPFGCEGETASCLCGDDCQCVGCLIHNHPYPES